MRGQSKRKMHQGKLGWARKLLFMLCLLAFLFSGGMLLHNEYRSDKEKSMNEILAQQVHSGEVAAQKSSSGEEVTNQSVASVTLRTLAEQYPDLIGWICIPGTAIDYPVMYTPDRPEHYLRRAYTGDYAISGTPFLAESCFQGCGNALIYGHNMDDGSMFADLVKYADPDFWSAHPNVQFSTLDESKMYEIIAAFYAEVSPQSSGGEFVYYNYTDLRGEERFDEYIAQVKAAAIYDTGVVAEHGDELLTLSTCSYHAQEGRFVVVAKRAEEQQS